MRRKALQLGLLVLPMSISLAAQQPPARLSFEPGGAEACRLALKPQTPARSPRQLGIACAQRDLALEKMREAAVAKSVEHAPAEQRVAFNAVTVAFDGFVDAHLANELCWRGSDCGWVRLDRKAEITSDFLKITEALLRDQSAIDGVLTGLSPEMLPGLDASLNDRYELTLAKLPTACQAEAGCTTQAGFRDTERGWIRYRDAMAAFAALRSPTTRPELWLAFLTRGRLMQIDAVRSGLPE